MSDRKNNMFGITSRFNHWFTALVFIGMLCFGFYLSFGGLEREVKGPLMGIHKSIGTLFLAFAFWRIGWRLAQGFPKDVAVMPAWQSIAAKATHWLLLLSVLAMPLSGVIMSIYGGRAINVFNWFTIPAQDKIETISGLAHSIHSYAPYAIAALITLHIAAALKHHFIDKDATLKRMVS
jgi:cytochrome b561